MLRRDSLTFKLSIPKPPSRWSYEIRFEDGKKYKNFKVEDIELIMERAKGAFGSVFEAVHKKSGRKIAVKKILTDGVEKGSFKKELDITKRIAPHDNIVRFCGFTFEEDFCYICMELMDVDLGRLYKYFTERGQQLSHEFIAVVAVSVVDGLKYLKEKYSVMHRDVKPSNILLDRKGYTKLCDFGVAGFLTRSAAQSEVGTAAYLAPEQIESYAPYTVAADVWSLGITLFEITTGRYPYEATDPYVVVTEIISVPAPQLDDSCGSSKELKDFINSCLTKDSELRPKYDKLVMTPLYKQVKRDSSRAAVTVGNCVEEYLKFQNAS